LQMLELPHDATPKQVRTQYRKLALQWHPDKNPPEQREHVQAKFVAITSAFQLISEAGKP
jgi:curved DNA-binding protein CbpA